MFQDTDVSVSFLVRGELGVPRSVPAPGGHRPSEVSPLDTRFHVRQKNLAEGLVFTLTDVFTTALTDANTNGLFPTDLTYLEEY